MLGMTILCILPIVIILFVGQNIFSAGYFWPIVIGAFAVLHIVLMFRGHGSQNEDDSEDKKGIVKEKERIVAAPVSEQTEPKKGGCCH